MERVGRRTVRGGQDIFVIAGSEPDFRKTTVRNGENRIRVRDVQSWGRISVGRGRRVGDIPIELRTNLDLAIEADDAEKPGVEE